MKHAAMNLITAEVHATNSANHLKRKVAENEKYNRANGIGKGVWMFAHGKDWANQLGQKAIAYNINHTPWEE
jgi:hypothetical protein